MNSAPSNAARLIALILAAIVFSSTILLFLRYARLRGSQAILAWFVSLAVACGVGFYRHESLEAAHRMAGNPAYGEVLLAGVCTTLCVLFASAFLIRLYRQWLDGNLTEAERAGGIIGMRAWLSPANLLMAVLISVGAWQGLDWSLLLMLVVTIGALVAWPALHADPNLAPNSPMNTNNNLSGERDSREREKVLSLLEAGKISAEESAELLQALAAGAATPARVAPTGPRSVLGLAGAALVLVGFFLPWFSFSPGEKLASMMQDFHQGMGAPMLEMSKVMPTQKIQVRAGDFANGLGWIVLILALTSAVLPYFAQNLERSSLRTFRILALGAGGIILLYLLSQDLPSVAIGLIFALIGYACSALALWREERPLFVAPSPAEAQV